MQKNDEQTLVYIKLPPSFPEDLGGFHIDRKKRIPVLLPPGKTELDASSLEPVNIIAGLIEALSKEDEPKEKDYYRDFVLTVMPDAPEKLTAAAIAKDERGEDEFALDLFRAVWRLSPSVRSCINLAVAHSSRSSRLMEKGEGAGEELRLTEETLKEGIKRFGENEDILYELASFSSFAGERDEAMEWMDRYLEVASDEEKRSEIKKARKNMLSASENQKEIEEAYDFIVMGEGEKALKAADKMIERSPRLWNARFLRGWALRTLERYSEAKEEYLECLRLGERNAEIYNELSLCELKDGKRERAKAYLDIALDLDEKNINILTNVALLHLEDDEFDLAREALEKARAEAGDDKMVMGLIKSYEEKTGEKIGAVIREEYVPRKTDDEGEEWKMFQKGFETPKDQEEEDE